jgi:L-rhamnose-H+ transport protein
MESNILQGILFHSLGGIAAAACFVPQKGSPRWSFQTYFLLMCLVSWCLMPILVASVTIPDLMGVIRETPGDTLLKTTLLGALYGFGGMAFAMAIQYIGYSLTYAIAIGISAVVGTIMPQLLNGTIFADYSRPGGLLVLTGFLVSILGVALCGHAGFLKEQELLKVGHPEKGHTFRAFNMRKGLFLVLVAGVLSGVFGLALAQGAFMDGLAEKRGAGQFQGNAKYIFAMGGAFITNLIWWTVVHLRQGTFGEYTRSPQGGRLARYWTMGILGGTLWYLQFLFYGFGHVKMGAYGFVSWGIHMAMLIFFSILIGVLLKEWKGCRTRTLTHLALGLSILVASFTVISYGSWKGDQAGKAPSTSSTH